LNFFLSTHLIQSNPATKVLPGPHRTTPGIEIDSVGANKLEQEGGNETKPNPDSATIPLIPIPSPPHSHSHPPSNMRLYPPTIPIGSTIFLLLPSTTLAIPSPTPEPQIPTFGPTPTLAATQYPSVTIAGRLFTVNGVTSASWVEFTRGFERMALGGWGLGDTLRVGRVGLGGLEGSGEGGGANGVKMGRGGDEDRVEDGGKGEGKEEGGEEEERGEEEEGNGGVKEKRIGEKKKGEEKGYTPVFIPIR
jgi:hypothetical protein